MVRAGTSRGSLPQDDDVEMPPVALSATEHGMPRRLSAGSISFPDELAAVDGAPDGAVIEAAGLAVCACVDSRPARPRLIARTRLRMIALRWDADGFGRSQPAREEAGSYCEAVPSPSLAGAGLAKACTTEPPNPRGL